MSSNFHAHHLPQHSRDPVSSSTTASITQGTNIMENWLIKGLRLLHSPKPEDTAQLRKFYKDACENETTVTRTTLAEALRTSHGGDGGKDEMTGDQRHSSLGSRLRISAPLASSSVSCAGTESSDQSDSSNSELLLGASTVIPRRASFVNLFDVTDSASSVKITTGGSGGSSSSKYRTPPSSAGVMPTVVCQGKTILTEQSQIVVTTNEIGSTATAPSSSSTTVAMEAVADLVADLMCCVCGRMTAEEGSGAWGVGVGSSSSSSSVLAECARCNRLYHQRCHSPALIGRAPSGWVCSKCNVGSARRKMASPSSTLANKLMRKL